MTPDSLAKQVPDPAPASRYQPPRVETLDGVSLLYADVPRWKRWVKRAVDIVVSDEIARSLRRRGIATATIGTRRSPRNGDWVSTPRAICRLSTATR